MDKEYTPAEAKAWLAGYDAGKAFAKKEWVELTKEEMDYIEGITLDRHDAIRMAAVGLREKNA